MKPDYKHDDNMLEHILDIEQQDISELVKEEGGKTVDFEAANSCTLYIGDNLTNLSKVSKRLVGQVGFCYIDPPYNTGSKFIYPDSLKSKENNIFGSHAAWMAFMSSRLKAAKLLLSKKAIIAISIDDYEQPYLRVVMDKVFGESNFIGCLCIKRSNNGKGAKNSISSNHEYVVVYGMSDQSKAIGLIEKDTEKYDKADEWGAYRLDGLFRKKGDASLKTERPNMYYPLYYDDNGSVYTEKLKDGLKEVFPVDSKGIERRWLWGKDKANSENWKLFASKGGVIYVKNYHSNDKRVKPKSIWSDNRYLTERATNEIKDIFGDKVFDTPKPIALVEDLIDCFAEKDALILDFFAGTGTTAHATWNLNKRDNGNRRVILMESNSEIPQKHKAYHHGYKHIHEITIKRLEHLGRIYPDFSFKCVK